ncbi:MAG: hypothetical protein ACOC1K_05775 [Nanoarchaeota archaeon]
MDKVELRILKEVNIAKRLSNMRKEQEVFGFFSDQRIYRAS